MAVDWDHCGRETFERVVEALLHRLYSEADRVEAIDGRGGDGGRDILVIQGKRQRIFQLKYFIDGFTSERRKRRRQIEASYDAAMTHAPTDWILVVPSKLTPGERTYVEALAQRAATPAGLRISIYDRPLLDERLAAFPDLLGYFKRDDLLLEQAKVYNQERSILAGGVRELGERVSALGVVVDTCDPDWTVDFARQGDTVIHTLRAKHPLAAQVSPIMLSLTARLDDQPLDLQEAVRRSFGFGVPGSVTLPASSVQRWQVDGPAWLSQDTQHIQVTFEPIASHPLPGQHLELAFRDSSDTLSTSHEGVLEHVGAGHLGVSLRARFHGTIAISMLVPDESSQACTLQYSVQLEGADPVTMLRTISLLRALHTDPAIHMAVDGRPLARLRVPQAAPTPEQFEWLDRLEPLAIDLDVVQRHTGTHFAVPVEMSRLERIELRVARLLLEGHCVVHPLAQVANTTLSGSDSPHLRQLIDGATGLLMIESTNMPLTIGHRTLSLGPVSFISANAFISDRTTLNAALDRGTASGLPLKIEVRGGGHFRCFMRERVRDAELPLVAVPWALPGIDEARDLDAA